MSVLQLIFGAETVDLNCVQEFDPYTAVRRVATLQMLEGTVIQDSGYLESDGTITLSGTAMPKTLRDNLWEKYTGEYAEFDLLSTLYGQEERWLVAWLSFTNKPNNGFSNTYTFTIQLKIISKY